MSDEHPGTFQIHDSLKIFKNVCSWFENVPILVIFTKQDLFSAKSPFTEFENCFPEFKNGTQDMGYCNLQNLTDLIQMRMLMKILVQQR
jgi:hypothetical protein